jgi:hypothetical protein
VSFSDEVDAALHGLRVVLGSGDPPAPNAPAALSAAPVWPDWTGVVSDAANKASGELNDLRLRVHFDQAAAVSLIKHAGTVATHARTRMDGVQAGWQQDKARFDSIKDTPLGQLSLLHAGQQRLTDGRDVIRDAMNEYTSTAGKLKIVTDDLPVLENKPPSAAELAAHWKEGPGEPPPDPRIIGITPATDPQAPNPLPPGQSPLTDLNDTTPDWPHVVTGDGLHSYPLVDGAESPIKPGDGRRPLPTGVGRDPDGNVIVGIATPKYPTNAKNTPDEFTTKDTQVWNFADPKHPTLMGTLTDKSQASVYFNKQENQWVVVGNDGPNPGAQRHVWTAPYDPAHPNDWMSHLSDHGLVPAGGDRENQYYPLKGGGVMLLDASGLPHPGGGQTAPQGANVFVAGQTGGLTNSAITSDPARFAPLPAQDFNAANVVKPPIPHDAPPGTTWQFSAPYGPTVTNDVVHGNTETVTVQVSTWGQLVAPPTGPPLPNQLAGPTNNYFPQTFSYNVEIQH